MCSSAPRHVFVMMVRLTYFRYSSMTVSTGSGPPLLNTDGFHMAARANMTEEAPVNLLNSAMSACVFTRSREPPLQNKCVGVCACVCVRERQESNCHVINR